MAEQTRWQQTRALFASKNTHTEEINGEKFVFSPVSVEITFKFKTLAAPIAEAFAALFTKDVNDYGSIRRTIQKGGSGVEGLDEFITDPIKESLADLRFRQRSGAVTKLVERLLSTETKEMLGELVMDSLREIFPRGDKDNPPVKDFLAANDTEILVALLVGVAKANKGVFGPLMGAAGIDGQTLADAIKARVAKETGTKTKPTPPPPGSTPG